MNSCIAENKYSLTKELFDEGMKRVSGENYAPFTRKVIMGITALWLIMAALTVILRQNPLFVVFEAFALLLISLWITVYIPWNKRKKAYNRLLDQYGTEMERTTRFFEKEFSVNAGGRELLFSYEEIEKKLMSEHLLILLMNDRSGILIERNSFTLGSEKVIEEKLQNLNSGSGDADL